MSYGAAVIEVILERSGGSPVSYTGASNLEATNSAIVIWGHGIYSKPGTYQWTIKATGYEDATVIVDVS